MPIAYVLLTVDTGAEEAVLREIKAIRHVKEAHVVYGVYDIVAKVETDRMDELNDLLKTRIRKIPNVRSTLTMIVMTE